MTNEKLIEIIPQAKETIEKRKNVGEEIERLEDRLVILNNQYKLLNKTYLGYLDVAKKIYQVPEPANPHDLYDEERDYKLSIKHEHEIQNIERD